MRSWREAWAEALYGPTGFFRHETPGDHFRTSAYTSPLFASAIVELARRHGCKAVVDVGAGDGELLSSLANQAPDLALTGVDLRPRPNALPADTTWLAELPEALDGLVVANELLDNVPCTVAEVDGAGALRELLADGSLGPPLDDDAAAWSAQWWATERTGDRVEVGLARDRFWSDLVSRLRSGLAVAVDYGHLAADRPAFGTLTSFRHGHEVDLVLDGSADVTAHVAVDSLAAAVGGRLRRQRDVLHDLGLDGTRPPLTLGSDDPEAYVRALTRAAEVAELTARGGLGDFWWVVTERTSPGTRPAGA